MEDSDPRELMESAEVPEVEAPGPPMPDLIDLSDVLAQLSKLDDKRREAEVRLLSIDEVAKYVAPVFSENGALLPDWESSFFVGHVDSEGTVLGFITVQAVLHVEPMWVQPGHSHLLARIISTAVEEIRGIKDRAKVYLTAEDERVIRLCERMGMTREPGTPMTKWVGEVPQLQPQEPEPEPEQQPEVSEQTGNEGSE